MRERATARSQCRRYHLRLEHLLAALAVLEQVTNHGLKPEALAEHAASEQGEGWDAITACTSVSKARRSRGNTTHHDLQVNKFVDNGDVLLRDAPPIKAAVVVVVPAAPSTRRAMHRTFWPPDAALDAVDAPTFVHEILEALQPFARP